MQSTQLLPIPSIFIVFTFLFLLSACVLNVEEYSKLNTDRSELASDGLYNRVAVDIGRLPLLPIETLAPLRWEHRLLLVFEAAPMDQEYAAQLSTFEGLDEELIDRNMLWFHQLRSGQGYVSEGLRPSARLSAKLLASLQRQYNPDNKPFLVVLIGKDGSIKYVTDELLLPADLFAIIDAMPMRQQEMQENTSGD